jgi:hypothetical protein
MSTDGGSSYNVTKTQLLFLELIHDEAMILKQLCYIKLVEI